MTAVFVLKGMTRMDAAIAAGIIVNIASSVGIVLSNKLIWARYEFNFVVTLSFLHFVTTSLATRILLRFGLFQYKPAPISGLLPVSIGTLGSVVFMNLNLAENTVGFYQVSKLACIPITLFLEFILYRKQVSHNVRLSLVVILAGVGISTVSEVSVKAFGLVLGLIAVLFTAQGQIYTGFSQQKMGLDSMQLLHHTSPQIALGMLVCMFLFEDIGEVMAFEYTLPLLAMILLTCVLAVAVNISNYMVIGKTSPITYQVVGHAKTCLVLILGFTLFANPVTWRSIFGIMLALMGVFFYGEIKRSESKSAPSLPIYSSLSKEDEADA